MSGFQDVRDVMELSGPTDATARVPIAKKQKTVERRPDGITRELFALLGENPPPVAIVESKFKEKPRWMGKVNPWVWKPFENPARSDGLVLRHWERKSEPSQDLEYQFGKFNVKVDVPAYTDGEYEVLKDPDWTREETDYLFNLCREYDLRFVIIWDRYEFPAGKSRSVEDIKARYYSICRNLMELRTPLNQMTPEETQIFNLLNFDKERETARKNMAEVLFARTPEQVKEEEMLLVELGRITKNQAKNLEERKELFNRLEVPTSQGSIAAYTGSQGLAHLREMMVNSNDKNKKRKSIALGSNNSNNTDGPQQSFAVATSAERLGPGGGGGGPSQKDTPQPKKQVRKLTPEEELEFGVTYHDKLTSGVKFRSAMVTATVKGGTAQKVQAALAQLDISPRLAMPTTRTVQKFEQLQTSVGVLLDARKANDKIDNEQRVLKAQIEAAKEDT
ncbi:unnamed protein product [Tuber melanosporum]|uniref:SWR1-complex protein 4 n=1 Tax=Tuber melanosporum (strain Mel28) TaxID=656061 RepID=D5G3Z9_TUBMM|nr:uncharacterized protein GSTUM_00003882001 [Tuber melanosporum]CAZ79242.1 unnamed protein product [Tuber melanosporum]